MRYTAVHYQIRIKFKVVNWETHALKVVHPIIICTPFPGLHKYFFNTIVVVAKQYIYIQINLQYKTLRK